MVATADTDAEGTYSFPVETGTYIVQISNSNFEPGGSLEGFTATSPTTQTVNVVDANASNVDFGFCGGTGSLGNFVWQDDNNDGIQDPGEPGIPDVFIELVNEEGETIDLTVTDFDGFYTFLNVPAGTYTVRIDPSSVPPGLVPTYDLDGIATPNEATATLDSQEDRTDIDFGYGTDGGGGNASLGDRVWYDADGDGVQDAGENGLNGVTVELLDSGANVVDTTVTGADGIYTFSDLTAGVYTVAIQPATLPAGVAPTSDLDGAGSPHTATLTLANGDNRTDVDFGYRGTASIGDRVWFDIDGDGAQETGEDGLNGVTVRLRDGGGNVVASTVTGGDGNYSFGNLPAGTYTVEVVASTLPGEAAPTFDADGIATPDTATVVVAAGEALTQVGDGVQDSGEPGLNGVAVELLDGAGAVLASSSTTAAGIYGFNNLLAGSYSVRVVTSTLPPGLVQTYDLDGTGTAHIASLTLSAGQSRTEVDFGYRGTLQFGDRVWLDYDGNGVQDTGEPGIPSVTIELRNSSGTLVSTTITGANGLYSFYNLPAGTYTVTVAASTLPGGSVPTYDLDGIATPHTTVVVLTAGQNRTDVDFGYRLNAPGTATIGYWKNHSEAWPVTSITIGGVVYTKNQAIIFLGTPSRGDKSIDLFKQLVAAKLNVIVGNNSSCIYQTIASADAWMAAHPPGSNVGASSAAWTQASPWHTQLDNYNNGNLCAPHRD